jgi:regulator of sigma E protease
MMQGDTIISINNQPFDSYVQIQNYVDENKGKALTYQIKRGVEDLSLIIVPELMNDTGKGGIGIALAETGLVKYPWYSAIWIGIKQTVFLTWFTLVAFYELIKGLILGQGVSVDVSGPLGIAKLTGQVARLGFSHVLQFAAMLSINLAIINFLPIPALDGGRVLFLIIEKIKGRPVKKELEGVIHNIGFILLMLLVLVVTFRDVLKFGGKFAGLWGKFMGMF